MPTRIPVSNPESSEELRQLAEAIADLHYVIATIVENAAELIPGESVEPLKAAWEISKGSMETLVRSLDPSPDASLNLPSSSINYETLQQAELTGAVGQLKRSTLGKLKDFFFMFWNSLPRTEEKRAKSADAACDYLELGATVVSSIPQQEKVVELVSLVKQLIGLRAKRGF